MASMEMLYAAGPLSQQMSFMHQPPQACWPGPPLSPEASTPQPLMTPPFGGLTPPGTGMGPQQAQSFALQGHNHQQGMPSWGSHHGGSFSWQPNPQMHFHFEPDQQQQQQQHHSMEFGQDSGYSITQPGSASPPLRSMSTSNSNANGLPEGWYPTMPPQVIQRRVQDFIALRDMSLFALPLPPLVAQLPRQRPSPPGCPAPTQSSDSRAGRKSACSGSCFGEEDAFCPAVGPLGPAGSHRPESSVGNSKQGGSASSTEREAPMRPSALSTPRVELASGLHSLWRLVSNSVGAVSDIVCGGNQDWCGLNDPPPRTPHGMVPVNHRTLEALDMVGPMDLMTWSLRTAPPLDAGSQPGGTPSHTLGCIPEDDVPGAAQTTPGSPPMVNLNGGSSSLGPSEGHRRRPDRPMNQREVYRALTESHASMCSLKGNKATSPNQDRAFCASLGAGAAQIFGVFDGHGEQGHRCAEAVNMVLPKLILNVLYRSLTHGAPGGFFSLDGPMGRPYNGGDNPQEAAGVGFHSGFHVGSLKDACEGIGRAFEEMHELLAAMTIQTAVQADENPLHQDAYNSHGFRGTLDARVSGTTATVLCFLPGRGCLAAHVGDSRAILGVRRTGVETILGGPKWRITELTRDHKPTLPAERARIEEAGAQVVMVGQHPNVVHRVYTLRQPWPAINMSRSLGDLHAHTQGLSASADVKVIDSMWDPNFEEAVVLICSDGVWDVIDPETAVEIAAAHARGDPSAALANEAYERWAARCLQGNYSDDITAVVKFF